MFKKKAGSDDPKARDKQEQKDAKKARRKAKYGRNSEAANTAAITSTYFHQ
ncbi:hypothetical protein [Streptomyces sp. NBC_01431]|uniref:hypothetical protein n=1 Tax=Streptomyces sp. NBC_01431 TaxID=2903863 RepID=UPI002E32CE06|nr:hypothetical protein [Streptomyces sp. NBC_01431]